MLINQFFQSFCRTGKFFRSTLSPDLPFNDRAGLLHRRYDRRLNVIQLNDVVSEIRLDNAAYLTLFQGKHGVVKRFHHGTTCNEIEIATFVCRTWILGIFTCDIGEICRRALYFGEQFFCCCTCCFLF